ncbi:helix-turn-helix domain-containing protein [Streptomyces sp. NPDC005236]|uniref:helix-turn-helix domain-containing protein n=1 Tax=Streptomyces sp. NPDC005236 TaxID=3157028 RepID=UPI0033B59723
MQQLAEYRYRAVREVLSGSPIGEVAARYGTSRRTLNSWRRRFEQEGMPGLLDRSRGTRSTPFRCLAAPRARLSWRPGRGRTPAWRRRRASVGGRASSTRTPGSQRRVAGFPPACSPTTRTRS